MSCKVLRGLERLVVRGLRRVGDSAGEGFGRAAVTVGSQGLGVLDLWSAQGLGCQDGWVRLCWGRVVNGYGRAARTQGG